MMNRSRQTSVVVHVYDLAPANQYLNPVGLGAYHTGVVVNGVEYSFAGSPDAPGSGIQEGDPGYAPNAMFRQAVNMGEIHISQMEIQRVLDKLRPDFMAKDYHLIRKNCNNFSDAFCYELMGRHIPGWINRMAWWGNCCSCLWPDELQDRQPQSNVEVAPKFQAFQGQGNRLDGGSSEQKSSGSGGMFSRKPKSKRKNYTQGETNLSADERRRKVAEAAARRMEQQQGTVEEVEDTDVVEVTLDDNGETRSTPSSKSGNDTYETNLL